MIFSQIEFAEGSQVAAANCKRESPFVTHRIALPPHFWDRVDTSCARCLQDAAAHKVFCVG